MINYFNFTEFNNQYLLTNDFGRFVFINKNELPGIISGTIDFGSESGKKLCDNMFIYSGSAQGYIGRNLFHFRDSKNYVFSATALHIFVVTTACNLNCVYCQANSGNKRSKAIYMPPDIAEKSVDIALQSPQEDLSFEFQGGEPLLNFEVIKHIVKYTEERKKDKKISYSIVTNLTLLSDEIISFIKEHNITIATSLDGHNILHDRNRPFPDGKPSYPKVINALFRLKEAGIKVGAIQTTTKESLNYPVEIVNQYMELGFDNIFIRALSPLGCAQKQWSQIGYSAEEFVAFYNAVFHYILQRNKDGLPIQEGHASVFLEKILHASPQNYMELRSPCGASFGQLAYYANGDIFTCDEGRMLYEMGNSALKVGNVFDDSRESIIRNPVCRTVCLAGITEALPTCCDCVYQPYCGVCPAINLALENDIIAKMPNNYRCRIYKGMLDCIFSVLQRNDKADVEILKRWRA